MWDVFISHASEDKKDFVRPLAEELVKYGVKVWYDEFALELGDSLSESIDRGLRESKFGLIVISPAFLQKKWTDYELKSLLTKEVHTGKTILPIWHHVNQEDVMARSLYLADKFAISSSVGIREMAVKIIQIIRPDILSSFLVKQAYRRMEGGKREKKTLKELKAIEGVRHEKLPKHLVIGARVISTLFPLTSYEETLINFAKDADYDSEYILWIVMACVYIEGTKRYGKEMTEVSFGEQMFRFLLFLTLDEEAAEESSNLPDEVKMFLRQRFIAHAQAIFQMIEMKA